jgi:DNA (cytosine-5)-methyltransferase 1
VLRNGSYWSDADWINCHDGKARRAQSGIRFLVDGLPGRVDLWRVGGNAIVPEAAAEVIAAFMDVYGVPRRAAA